MAHQRVILLTSLAMIAFAANSLLCRAALRDTTIDAASFTTIRLLSGALMLFLIVGGSYRRSFAQGNWWSALALFAYAGAFSFAYRGLTAATGALLLFGAVQATMIGYGFLKGERLAPAQLLGFLLALAGLIGLLLPGLAAPPAASALLMLLAGAAWGVYSLRGKGQKDAVAVTAGNFCRAVPLALLVSLAFLRESTVDWPGFWYAVASGALASGLGYAIWYTALPALRPTQSAVIQLTVPLLTAVGGILLLGEVLTVRLFLAAIAILGGVALVVTRR